MCGQKHESSECMSVGASTAGVIAATCASLQPLYFPFTVISCTAPVIPLVLLRSCSVFSAPCSWDCMQCEAHGQKLAELEPQGCWWPSVVIHHPLAAPYIHFLDEVDTPLVALL